MEAGAHVCKPRLCMSFASELALPAHPVKPQPGSAGRGGQGWNSFLNMRSALHCKEACGSPQAIKALQSHSPAGRERFNGLLGGVTPWVWGKLGNVFVLQCCFWLFVDGQPDIIFLL